MDDVSQAYDPMQKMMEDLTRLLSRRRKPPTAFVRNLAFQVAQHRRNGFCPCCQDVRILDESGHPLPGTELDHWFSVDRNGAEEMWPVCRKCNMLLTKPSYKTAKTSAFFAFRQAVCTFLLKQQGTFFGDNRSLEA